MRDTNFKQYYDEMNSRPEIDLKFSQNSIEIMKVRHLMKNEKGDLVEEPQDMFWRVARTIAIEDAKYLDGSEKTSSLRNAAEEFFYLMAENRFLPGSRVLYEAGNDNDGTGQLSSCFVLPIEDKLDSIFQTMKEAAVVQKNNGGTGFNFSHIRPKGDEVGGTPNVAAGPIHFIKTFSQAFDNILQGKKRGGGNMAILNVDHPDIEEFIELKGQDSSIKNFNISVGISDKFMEAVREDADFELINPRNKQVVKTVKAKQIFERICEKAWECADPGIFFADTVQRANPTKPLGIIEATNPCGEEPLRAYESCNLGSIVLPSHLKKNGDKYEIDWDLMKKSIHSAIHFLENMIDSSKFPLEKIQEQVNSTRKLGLGVVGLGTMFYKMGIAYNSEEGVNLTREIIKFIQDESVKQSIKLAEVRGVFPGFERSKWDEAGLRVRNATMTSIAPTGTLSLVANTSSGIEPIFSLAYKKMNFYGDNGGGNKKALYYINEEFEAYAKEKGFYTEDLMQKIAENHGTLAGIEGIPEEAKRIFVTTHDISPEWHVKMQAAAQDNVDAAVSKTINLPSDATISDVRKAYILAWETGCKGITIYRDGSKSDQVLENVSTEKKSEPVKSEVVVDMKSEKLTPNAVQVLQKRALKQNENGEYIETPEGLWRRIADHIAKAEKEEKRKEISDKFYEVMDNGEFLSGGTLLWAGMGAETIMSKCLVLPVDDSIDSIFRTLNWNIQCLRRGVGTGFNFSKLRSSYSKVGMTGEFAAGPVEYLRMYNRAQDTIKGRGGRGLGSMAILNADHPNIEDFIECKDDLTSITHYNISIGASDKFMNAVKEDMDWELIDPHDKVSIKTIKARELFEKIAKHAWLSGDPGMYFIDIAEKGNTTPSLGTMDATNPCGEQPLIPFETCNMGHINVSKFVNGFPFIEKENIRSLSIDDRMDMINWDRLREVVKIAVRFLDNIIDVNNYPISEIEEMTKKTRNIGVGIMGFTDMLIKLGVVYGSDESMDAAERIMEFINDEAHKASIDLGKEKGSFPAFHDSVWVKQVDFMRNTRVTTIAPTGTISIIADCNPGIEPIFALGYRRKNSMGGTDQEVIDPLFEKVAKARGFHSPELMHKISDGAHLHDIASEFNIPEDVVEVFKTTHEIKPESHVYLQAAFQKYVDSAVSKTINLPNNATWRDIARVYQLAWETGCKGITIFRDGSKDPALQVGTKEKAQSKPVQNAAPTPTTNGDTAPRNSLDSRERAAVTHGKTYEVKTEQGKLFITINEDDKGLCETFLTIGKSGSFTAGYTEAIGRLISMALRSGVKPEIVIKALQGIRTSTPTFNKGMIVYSVPDAIAKTLKKHIDEKKNQISMLKVEETIATPTPSSSAKAPTSIEAENEVLEKIEKEERNEATKIEAKPVEKVAPAPNPVTIPTTPKVVEKAYTKTNSHGDLFECPDCGGDLEYAEGCILCRSCGYSKCG